jgi:hypothetical protein
MLWPKYLRRNQKLLQLSWSLKSILLLVIIILMIQLDYYYFVVDMLVARSPLNTSTYIIYNILVLLNNLCLTLPKYLTRFTDSQRLFSAF